MIRTFRHKGLQCLCEKDVAKGLSAGMVPKIERILARLDVATGPEMIDLPGYRLHPLKGDLRGYWSVWVTGNWRIIFRFDGSHVLDVDLVDYH